MRRTPGGPALWWTAFWLIVTGALAFLIRAPLHLNWLWAILLGVTATTWAAYGVDKFLAERGWRRTPEVTLLLLGLLGGAVGALAGQQFFRHKTSKQSFQRSFWIIVGIQVVALAVYLRYR